MNRYQGIILITQIYKKYAKISIHPVLFWNYTYISYLLDTMGRMHSDAQFAGSSSVPAHVEMMGFLGMGNNPMVGATVAIAVAIQHRFAK